MKVNTKISLFLLVPFFCSNCNSKYESFLMRSTAIDGRSYYQILILNKNNIYEFLDSDITFKNVIKGDLGEYDVKGDTLVLKYQHFSNEYLRENSSKIIYPILHIIDSTGTIINKSVSYGFGKKQLEGRKIKQLLKRFKNKKSLSVVRSSTRRYRVAQKTTQKR